MASYGSIQTATLDPGETAIIITKPSGLAAGDLMIALLAVTGPNQSYTASGWDELFAQNIPNFNYKMNCLVKVADSSDAAASNFTFNVNASGDSKVGALLRVTGTFVGTGNCIFDKDVVTSDTTPTFTGGVTPLTSTSLLIMGCFSGTLGTSSNYAIANNNPTWTERADISVNDAEDISLSVATADYASASATGDYSLSITDGTESGGYIIAISDTANVSSTLTPLTMGSTMPNLAFSSDVSATLTPLIVGSVLPTLTATSENGEWTDQSKNAVDDWDNQTKQ